MTGWEKRKRRRTGIKAEARRKTGSSSGVPLGVPAEFDWTGRVGGVTAEIQSGEFQKKRHQRHQPVGAQSSTGEVPWSCAPVQFTQQVAASAVHDVWWRHLRSSHSSDFRASESRLTAVCSDSAGPSCPLSLNPSAHHPCLNHNFIYGGAIKGGGAIRRLSLNSGGLSHRPSGD